MLGGLLLLLSACATDSYRDAARPTPAERLATAERADPDAAAAARALGRVARASLKAGDPGSAINIYRRALGLLPNDVELLTGTGEALLAASAADEARLAFSRALEVAPTDRHALQGLGRALIVLGEPGLALEPLRDSMAETPDSMGYNLLGIAHEARHDAARAMAAFRAGLALDPEHPALLANLAFSLTLAGQTEEAIALLAPLVRNGQATRQGRQNLALALGLAGRDREALTLLVADHSYREAQRMLAWYEMLQGLSQEDRRLRLLGTARHTGQPG